MKGMKYISCILLLALVVWSGWPVRVYAAKCTQPQHEYKSQVIRYADPETDGEREFVCIHCGDTYTEVLPRTGHEYGDYQVEKAATCASEGLRYRTCITCGKIEYEVIPFTNEHDFSDWFTQERINCEDAVLRQRYCRICGQTEEEVLEEERAHEYEETTIAATCTEDGEIRHQCKNCSHSHSEIIAALGHKYGEEIIRREPTEENEGLAVRICEHDATHVLERIIPRLAVAETETEVPETEKQTEVAEEPKKDLTPAEAAVVGVNTLTFGIFFVLIKRDYNVLRWEKRNRKLMYERGEWQ